MRWKRFSSSAAFDHGSVGLRHDAIGDSAMALISATKTLRIAPSSGNSHLETLAAHHASFLRTANDTSAEFARAQVVMILRSHSGGLWPPVSAARLLRLLTFAGTPKTRSEALTCP